MKFAPFLAVLIAGVAMCFSATAQTCSEASAPQLYQQLLKSNNLGTVLYIAAHPDDENTRLISYLENGLHLRVGYLSLTRGDGGQNLIGTEIGAGIGVLRTQELLAARRIDQAEQFFSRAVDFGYSKSSTETLEMWDRQKILADVVWVIRTFKPDVIITRFPPNEYAGHGHHSTSAILAEEAFEAAADPKRFPEQLQYTQTWSAKRLYFNASTWWSQDLPEKAEKDSSILVLNPGEFNPLLGRSYAGIAAISRSQHRSQGFGSAIPKGDQLEYLTYVKGEPTSASKGLFAGIDTSWSRVENSDKVQQNLTAAIENFDFTNPGKITPYIINALQAVKKIEDKHWKRYKTKELEDLLAGVAGFWAEALAPDMMVTNGEDISVTVQAINRGSQNMILDKIAVNGTTRTISSSLAPNELFTEDISVTISSKYSNPYWLNSPYSNYFIVEDQQLIGKAENDPALTAEVKIRINDYPLSRMLPVQNKIVDPVKAEIYNPVYVVPAVTMSFNRDVVLLPNSKPATVSLSVQNHSTPASGIVSLMLPDGYTSTPEKLPVSFSRKGETITVDFQIRPAESAPTSATIGAMVEVQDSTYTNSLQEISYEHIPTRIILKPARVEVRNFPLHMAFDRIGYIEGPGDEVAEYLRAAGFQVDVLQPSDLPNLDLAQYPAIVTGIRAYNTQAELKNYNEVLSSYVENGGTWLVQYNTNRHLLADQIGPYPFTIGRGRVTEETAEVKILKPQHPVFHYPNEINPADFENWVQERGLYFAESWSDKFTPLIGWHDRGEEELHGALIVAPYGKGYFVYSGISFFRHLPAGVPGSYRLLTNILSLSRHEQN